MISMTLKQAALVLDAIPLAVDGHFHGISIDSRNLAAGNLFIAIPGSQADGHHYLEEAKNKGAAAALVMHQVETDLPQLVIRDSFLGLGKLAGFWRNQFHIPFIAATGSNGKTTLKNMLAAIFTAACDGDESKVLANRGNLNNHLGLPLTLARLNKQHAYAVIEMGMNHFGEIEYLSKLTRPDIAIINNAAAAHLEGVGDLAGVAKAKAEIFAGLSTSGTAILNRDDAFYSFWREQIGNRRHLSFGLHQDADVTVITSNMAQNHFEIHTPKGQLTINLPLLGKHNILNALAATAATLAAGIDLPAVKMGLENIKPEPGRLQVHNLDNGVKIIDDTYNANPMSLQAAVETLATFPGKKILVLGDMRELGEEAKKMHTAAGERIRQSGIDYLFTYGDLSANASAAFGEGAFHFKEQEKLVAALKPFLCNTATILIKGSRSMRMEKVVTGLLPEQETARAMTH